MCRYNLQMQVENRTRVFSHGFTYNVFNYIYIYYVYDICNLSIYDYPCCSLRDLKLSLTWLSDKSKRYIYLTYESYCLLGI